MITILIERSNPTTVFAAEELKKYLRMLMPKAGDIAITCDSTAEKVFRLGLMTDFGLDMSDAEDPALDDIVYINTTAEGGVIAGSNPIALLIAVYRYLRLCGCRWLFPGVDGEYIPLIEALPAVTYRKLADHRYRGQCNEGAEFQQNMLESIDFSPKIGLNTYMIEFDTPAVYYQRYYGHDKNTVRESEPLSSKTILQWKRQCEVEIAKRGMHFHDMGHGWTAEPFGINSECGWDSVEDESAAVPERVRPYLAEVNGKRGLWHGVPLNTQICLSNPEARRMMIQGIADYAEVQNNVDFLHVWLADGSNNTCECEVCRRKNLSDWYVTLMNELDVELTRRHLSTHIVFLAYVDLFWAPKEMRIANPDRFTMLYAPITRLYSESYEMEADTERVVPYQCNHNIFPKGMRACLGYLQEWKQVWPGDCFCYEYHFWNNQYNDPSQLYLAELLHRDITSLRKHSLRGIVEDGSQRSFFPIGFAFYVYGETLFDANLSFEALRDDYFRHAYGQEWQHAWSYLEAVRDRLDFQTLYRFRQTSKANWPTVIAECIENGWDDKLKELQAITASFRADMEHWIAREERVSVVAWSLLKDFTTMVKGLICMYRSRLAGEEERANQALGALRQHFSEREIYIERYYDHYLFGQWLR